MHLVMDITHYDKLSWFWVVTRNLAKWILKNKWNDKVTFVSNKPLNLTDLQWEYQFVISNSWFIRYKFIELDRIINQINGTAFLSLDHTLPLRKVCKYAVVQHDIWVQRTGLRAIAKHFWLRGVLKTLYYWIDLEWIALKKADLIICPSEYVKNDIVDYYKIGDDKIIVTPWWMDHITDNVQDDIKKEDYILFPYCHTHDWFAFELAEMLISSGLAKKAVFIKPTDAPMTKLSEKIQVITRNVTEAENRELYSKAKVSVYTTWNDGFWIVPLESMRYGTPVVFNDNTSLREISWGWWSCITKKETKPFIDEIRSIVEDESKYSQMVSSGLNWSKKYAWQNTAEAIVNKLKTLKTTKNVWNQRSCHN